MCKWYSLGAYGLLLQAYVYCVNYTITKNHVKPWLYILKHIVCLMIKLYFKIAIYQELQG